MSKPSTASPGVQVDTITRVFRYNGRDLPDPNPTLSPAQVRDYFSNQMGELTTATIAGPTVEGSTYVYTFAKAVGTKG